VQVSLAKHSASQSTILGQDLQSGNVRAMQRPYTCMCRKIGEIVSNSKRGDLDWIEGRGCLQGGYKEEVCYSQGGEAVAQVAQRGDGCSADAQVRLDGALSTDRAVGVPAHCRQCNQMAFKDPFQLKQFYEAVMDLEWMLWCT